MDYPVTKSATLAPGWRSHLLAMNDPKAVMVVPTGRALGAEILGVDLSQPISARLAERLRQAWSDHVVLLFRQQSLSAEAQVAAASIFGKPEVPAAAQYFEKAGLTPPNSLHPNIMLISNLNAEGLPVAENDGLGSGEVVWHSDNSYKAIPPSGSMLYAVEVPPQGGDTSFSNQYAAYETLPDCLRERCLTLSAVHDASRNSAGKLRPGVAEPITLADVPGPIHPLVRKHPTTGRPALYLGRRRTFPSQYIPGLPEQDSEALLNTLWRHASASSLTWSHQWTAGDLILWDNRAAMHRREPHDPRFPRILHRVQLAGEPVERWSPEPAT